jgi:hypothetical protein
LESLRPWRCKTLATAVVVEETLGVLSGGPLGLPSAFREGKLIPLNQKFQVGRSIPVDKTTSGRVVHGAVVDLLHPPLHMYISVGGHDARL